VPSARRVAHARGRSRCCAGPLHHRPRHAQPHRRCADGQVRDATHISLRHGGAADGPDGPAARTRARPARVPVRDPSTLKLASAPLTTCRSAAWPLILRGSLGQALEARGARNIRAVSRRASRSCSDAAQALPPSTGGRGLPGRCWRRGSSVSRTRDQRPSSSFTAASSC